jgi:hypothetical protein
MEPFDWLLLWLLLLFVVFCFAMAARGLSQSGRKKRQAAEKFHQLTDATRSYIDGLEQSRAFTPVEVLGLHLEQGEFAVKHDSATLAEMSRSRVGGGIGTRVRIGGFPIYLGGWKNVSVEELREVGTGELVLTNHRLLFFGARTLAIPFDRLLECKQQEANLVISESQSKSPHAFVMDNAGFWYFLVNWMADNRFEDPHLPDGLHISVTGEPPHLLIQIAGGVDSAPTPRHLS